jgi:hypothetical protein
MSGLTNNSGLFVFLFVCFLPLFIAAQKNDTVYLKNGDKITGEFKRYENGLLVLKTNGMSTLNIEYDKIRTIYSLKYFDIVKKTGFSYFGSISTSKRAECIDIIVSGHEYRTN